MITLFVELVARGALVALSISALLAILCTSAAFAVVWLGAAFRVRASMSPERSARPGA
jgi:hypothetical protein